MAVYEVFAHPELRRYKTTIVSKASVFLVFCFLVTFIVPVLITYRSGGFWIKEATYQESPDIAFKHEFMLVLDLDGGQVHYATYSTFKKYNGMQWRNLRVPVVTSREEDENGDGRPDRLNFNLEMPLLDTENVRGIRLVLFFYYKLNKYSSFHMESLGLVSETAPIPAKKIYIAGDLSINQREALAHKGIDARYNGSLIDSSQSFAKEYDIQNLLEKYNSRNVTTRFVAPDILWTTVRAPGTPFEITANIGYPVDETYRYTPGFWYMVKWAWVQYLSVLIIFLYIFERVKVFAFMNQIFSTIMEGGSQVKNRRLM